MLWFMFYSWRKVTAKSKTDKSIKPDQPDGADVTDEARRSCGCGETCAACWAC